MTIFIYFWLKVLLGDNGYRQLKNLSNFSIYFQDKGTCALHMASSAGQAMQVELLLVYGADPGAYDANGKTPTDHAK